MEEKVIYRMVNEYGFHYSNECERWEIECTDFDVDIIEGELITSWAGRVNNMIDFLFHEMLNSDDNEFNKCLTCLKNDLYKLIARKGLINVFINYFPSENEYHIYYLETKAVVNV